MATIPILLLLSSASLGLARSDFELFHLQGRDDVALYDGSQTLGVKLPLYNDLAHQRYLVNVTVGTPPQPFAVLFDTGSTDFWLPLPNSSGCAPNPCPPGTFSPNTSSSITDTGVSFNASYGLTPDLMVLGEYWNDTVTIGNVTLKKAMFAVVNVPKPIFDGNVFGILGLGSRFSEALYVNPWSPYWNNASATYTPLWERLTATRFFSVWLNKQSARQGTALIGGVDETKYQGHMRSTPVRVQGRDRVFVNWQINLTSVARIDGHDQETPLTQSNFSLGVVLDTGSPNMYLPTSLYTPIAASLNASMVNNTPYVPCSFRSSTSSLVFGFLGTSNLSGPKIKVPIPEIIYPFGYPANPGEVRDGSGRELCYFGLIPTDGMVQLLGATMLRSAYVVFDAEKLEIGMAQARY